MLVSRGFVGMSKRKASAALNGSFAPGPLSPLCTDMYQLTMAYGYWKAGRHNEHAVFDLFFRKNPFKGGFTVFGGLSDIIEFIEAFKFTESDIEFLRGAMPAHTDPAFFAWLASVDMAPLKVYAVAEGTIVFPSIPVVRVVGPLALGQLVETTLLNLANFASLMTTNAVRFRHAAGPGKTLLEFGLRRAQGPNGGMSASRYSYMGGFDGTSNMLAGKLYGVPVKGTHAHAYVQSYRSLDELASRELDGRDLAALACGFREKLGFTTNDGELAAFVAYSLAFPDGLIALIDTYDTLKSGLPNFICVALALHELGRRALGVRIDSGDLAYLSREIRARFVAVAAQFDGIAYFAELTIVASNDINEAVLHALKEQGHEIDAFGIGTHLVTCQAQPALGMVYKLVEIEGNPRIKLSNDVAKVTIPGEKQPYRLMGAGGVALLDLMVRAGEAPPVPGERVLCRHPYDDKKRAFVTPAAVVSLHRLYWDGAAGGRVEPVQTLEESRAAVQAGLPCIREDTLREVNPTPYKVAVSDQLFNWLHELWNKEVPIPELS